MFLGVGILLLAACSGRQGDVTTESATPEAETGPAASSPTALATDTPQPTESPASSPTPQPPPTAEASAATAVEPAYTELLSYMPAFYADLHLPIAFGPPLYLLDVSHMRNDLGIGPITGASDYKEKLELVIALNENTQGLSTFPMYFFPTTSVSFEEWGWDFSDVDAVLCLRGDGLTIMTGDFSGPEVMKNLKDKGEELPSLAPFSLFRIADGKVIVAVKPDTLIVSVNPVPLIQDDPVEFREEFVRMTIETNLSGMGLEDHPVIRQLLAEIPGSWGAIISPSPDMVGWENQLWDPLEADSDFKLPDVVIENLEQKYDLDAHLAPLPWDLMAIGFNSSDEENELVLVYHYPGGGVSEAEVDLARSIWSEITSLHWQNAASEDLLSVVDVQVREPLLIMRGATRYKDFLGTALDMRDYSVQLGLALIREEE